MSLPGRSHEPKAVLIPMSCAGKAFAKARRWLPSRQTGLRACFSLD